MANWYSWKVRNGTCCITGLTFDWALKWDHIRCIKVVAVSFWKVKGDVLTFAHLHFLIERSSEVLLSKSGECTQWVRYSLEVEASGKVKSGDATSTLSRSGTWLMCTTPDARLYMVVDTMMMSISCESPTRCQHLPTLWVHLVKKAFTAHWFASHPRRGFNDAELGALHLSILIWSAGRGWGVMATLWETWQYAPQRKAS